MRRVQFRNTRGGTTICLILALGEGTDRGRFCPLPTLRPEACGPNAGVAFDESQAHGPAASQVK